MGFKGDLNTFNLANIFQTLAMNRQTGTLAIYNKGASAEGYVLFEDGLVRQVALSKAAKLRFGEVLIRTGMLSNDNLEKALATQRTTKELLGDVLVRMNLLTQDQITQTLRFQQEETLFELFGWQEALFEFSEKFPSESVFDPEISKYNLLFNTNSILMEAMRRLDEWSRIRQYLPTDKEIPAVINADASALNENRQLVLSLVNGINSAKKICTLSYLGNFNASQILADLLKTGYIRLKERNELVQTGYDCLRNGFYEDGIAILSLVLSQDFWEPDVVEHLGEAYRAIGDSEKAVECFKEVVAYYSDRSDFSHAIAIQQQVVDLEKANYVELVLLGDLYFNDKTNGKASEQYRLALNLVDDKENPQAFIDISERMIPSLKSDLKIREDLVEVLVRVGNKKSALAHLVELAVLYTGQGDYKTAIGTYHRMVSLAPESSEYRNKLEHMVNLEGKRRSRRLQIVRVCVLLVLLFSVVGIGLGYVVHTRAEFSNAEIEADRLAKDGKFTEAISCIDNFVNDYPLAPLISRAKQKIEEYTTQEQGKRAADNDEYKRSVKAAIEKAQKLRDSIPAQDKDIPIEKMLATVMEAIASSQFEEEKRIYTELETKLLDIQRTITSYIRQFNKYLADGDINNAHEIVVLIGEKYSSSTEIAALRIPFQVDCSLPENAEVYLAEKLVGTVPQLLMLEQRKPADVTISAKGFAPFHKLVIAEERPSLTVLLERMPYWNQKIDVARSFETCPVTTNDKICFVTRNGSIYSVNRDTGVAVSSTSLEKLSENSREIHDVTVNSVSDGNILYIPSLDGNLYAVDINASKLLWQYTVKDFLRSEPIVVQSDKIGKVVIFGAENGKLYCLTADTGLLVWTAESKASILSSAVVADNCVYFSSRDGSFYKVGLGDGKLVKKIQTSAPISSSPTIYNDLICFGNEGGDFYIVRRADMSVVNYIHLADCVVVDRPVIFGNFLVVATTGKMGDDTEPSRVKLVNMKDLSVDATFSFAGKLTSQPSIYNNELYCSTASGTVMCFKVASKDKGSLELLWKFEAGARISGDPLVVKDMIVFITERGTAISFQ